MEKEGGGDIFNPPVEIKETTSAIWCDWGI